MFNKKISRYSDDDIVQYRGENIIDIKEKINLKKDKKDILYEIKPGDTLRDAANNVYHDARLWWVIADCNNILDPYKRLEAGKYLTCPTLKHLMEENIV